MELLLNFKRFTSFSYKISLIKSLIDRLPKICSNWNSFHNDTEKIISNLIKNAYPPFLIDKVVKKYLDQKFSIPKVILACLLSVHNIISLYHVMNKYIKTHYDEA